MQRLVFQMEQDAADDYRTDPALLSRCREEIPRLCSTQPKHGGAVQASLALPLALRSPACGGTLPAALGHLGQGRSCWLDRQLTTQLTKCALACDASRPPPSQECLWEHRGALGWACASELFRQAAEESDDIRLAVGLMNACADDKERVGAGAEERRLL